MWRDILVHVDGSTAGRERAEYSLRLAELIGTKVHGLHVEQPRDVPPVFKPRMIHAPEKYQEREAKLDAARSGQAFHDIARPSDSWMAIKGDMAETISQYAAYYDLAIAGQYETTGTPEKRPLTLAASLVLKCDRSALLLPARHKVLPANPHIALAEFELLEILLSENPDTLVMNAYENSPWFELLCGGLTQSAALNSQTPVLFSH